jgi:hypothetical protein
MSKYESKEILEQMLGQLTEARDDALKRIKEHDTNGGD